MEDIKVEYPEDYLKMKNLGYDSIELRKMIPNFKQDFHFHPFTASMIIIKGNVTIVDDKEEIHKLKRGDFISVDSMQKHNEKTDSGGATFLYGKKYSSEHLDNNEILKHMLDEFHMADQSWPKLAYIRKSPASFMLYLLFFKQYYSEKWYSQEKILNSIPKRYGSRSTILNIINDGIERKNIIKKITHQDKRSVFYELSEPVFYEMNSWLGKRKNILQDII